MGTVLSEEAEQQVIAVISEFEQVVDTIYGIYLENTLGFNLAKRDATASGRNTSLYP